jgi:hypothetical protein
MNEALGPIQPLRKCPFSGMTIALCKLTDICDCFDFPEYDRTEFVSAYPKEWDEPLTESQLEQLSGMVFRHDTGEHDPVTESDAGQHGE